MKKLKTFDNLQNGVNLVGCFWSVVLILEIVDVWDALTSDPPYRSAWSAGRTRQYLQELSGSHFEPRVVTSFLEMLDGNLGDGTAMNLSKPA